MYIGTGIRRDNSSVAEHVHPISSVTEGRRLNGLLESNREELGNNAWLDLSHIMGGLGISDEMANATTQNKLILA